MKKSIFTLVCVFAFITVQAQGWFSKVTGNGNVITETRNTAPYDKIAAGGSFDVILVKGKEGEISLEGEENILSIIETEVEGDKLKIRFKKGVRFTYRHKVTITVPFEDLNEVSFAGSGNLRSSDVIKASKIEASLAGSGDVDLPLEGDEIRVSVSGSGELKARVQSQNLIAALAGSGDILLDGSTQSIEVKVSGSGNVRARSLESKTAKVSIAGSGDVEVVSRDEIYARVSGSGDIDYYGKPAKEDIKVSGSGKVMMKN